MSDATQQRPAGLDFAGLQKLLEWAAKYAPLAYAAAVELIELIRQQLPTFETGDAAAAAAACHKHHKLPRELHCCLEQAKKDQIAALAHVLHLLHQCEECCEDGGK